jgi:membrane-associated phospholipid phosphatase
MGKLFRRLTPFWIALGCGLVLLLFVLIRFEKGAGFLSVQIPHSDQLNLLFGIFTFPGDGLFAIAMVLLLLVMGTYRKALTLLTGYISGGLLVQLGKLVIFTPTPRPVKWFELNKYPFELPEGLNPHMWHSFPSGHSASAATLFLFFACMSNKKSVQFTCGLLALLVGYSRIYLFMHFPEDVFTGLIIGAFAMLVCQDRLDRWFDRKAFSWANKNLLKR